MIPLDFRYNCEVCGRERFSTYEGKKVCFACNIKAKKERERSRNVDSFSFMSSFFY